MRVQGIGVSWKGEMGFGENGSVPDFQAWMAWGWWRLRHHLQVPLAWMNAEVEVGSRPRRPQIGSSTSLGGGGWVQETAQWALTFWTRTRTLEESPRGPVAFSLAGMVRGAVC